AAQQRPQPISRRAAVRVIACPARSFGPGHSRLVSHGFGRTEEESSIVEGRIRGFTFLAEVLAPRYKQERPAHRRVVGWGAGDPKGPGWEQRGGEVGVAVRAGVSARLRGRTPGIAPGTVRGIGRAPAEGLGQLAPS